MTLFTALSNLIARPVDLTFRRWNRKAAFFSSLIRGTIFLLANLRTTLIPAGWSIARDAAGSTILRR